MKLRDPLCLLYLPQFFAVFKCFFSFFKNHPAKLVGSLGRQGWRRVWQRVWGKCGRGRSRAEIKGAPPLSPGRYFNPPRWAFTLKIVLSAKCTARQKTREWRLLLSSGWKEELVSIWILYILFHLHPVNKSLYQWNIICLKKWISFCKAFRDTFFFFHLCFFWYPHSNHATVTRNFSVSYHHEWPHRRFSIF